MLRTKLQYLKRIVGCLFKTLETLNYFVVIRFLSVRIGKSEQSRAYQIIKTCNPGNCFQHRKANKYFLPIGPFIHTVTSINIFIHINATENNLSVGKIGVHATFILHIMLYHHNLWMSLDTSNKKQFFELCSFSKGNWMTFVLINCLFKRLTDATTNNKRSLWHI